ncbi:cation diffusion facilitator family transporter (plasmid) [Rhizobium sp. CC1099]|uniref:cation diffusion facilitator family transporter n=1 Tax=Rhizobium sp. CC1099 TaxID=3039160 RepID=UPI0024B24A21|nr:cation diffusion facilitator family transporter [Rhizobium sp. CC1099]WFU91376.1 cation diffusion facilitator family transporter [Rhizobium sp. CC1099]
MTIVIIGLISDLVIATIKFVAAYFSGSAAMSSEGIHSLIDASTEVILCYGLIVSSRKASPLHQLGYGREVYFWNFVVAVLIFSVGAGVTLLAGFRQVASPRPLENEWVTYVVLALSAVVDAISLWISIRRAAGCRGRETLFAFMYRRRDPTTLTIVVGGVAALVGLACTASGIIASQLTGDPRYDGIASIVISVILALAAFKLAADSKALLIGLPADPVVANSIINQIEKCACVRRVNGMVSVHLAPEQLLVAVSVWFDAHLSTEELEAAIVEVENGLHSQFPSIRALFIEPQTPERFDSLKGSLSSTLPAVVRDHAPQMHAAE